jgi:hypothetical protein
MTTIAQIEETLLGAVANLGAFATVQSAGRKALPEIYAYPACFVYWAGDTDAGAVPRPVDVVEFRVVVQVINLATEGLAAQDAYALNDLVRAAIRGKTLGFASIGPFVCQSRQCTDYDDETGMIEYTHTYSTKLYNPVPTPG